MNLFPFPPHYFIIIIIECMYGGVPIFLSPVGKARCFLTDRFAKAFVAAMLPIFNTSLREVDRIKDSMFS